jgi:hypothetical protein
MRPYPAWKDLPDDQLGRKEADVRVKSVAVVMAAMADGTWPTNAYCLGTITSILTDAERFCFVAEFEPAA